MEKKRHYDIPLSFRISSSELHSLKQMEKLLLMNRSDTIRYLMFIGLNHIIKSDNNLDEKTKQLIKANTNIRLRNMYKPIRANVKSEVYFPQRILEELNNAIRKKLSISQFIRILNSYEEEYKTYNSKEINLFMETLINTLKNSNRISLNSRTEESLFLTMLNKGKELKLIE